MTPQPSAPEDGRLRARRRAIEDVASWLCPRSSERKLGETGVIADILPAMTTDHEVTGLLQAWSEGDGEALDELLPMVFDDLHRMARYFFQRESDTHTLRPTALISELYVRMRAQEEMHWDSRAGFFNFAADVMRNFLVDYARRRKAEKRGGGKSECHYSMIAGFTWMHQPVNIVTAFGICLEMFPWAYS